MCAIRYHLLRRLYLKKAFVHGHLLGEHLLRCVPSHLRGRAKETLKELVKEGLIAIYGPTKYGIAYQLNIDKLDEIERILQE
uniref:MMGP4 n=1 Tax=uncultured organism TaxID=155900 RepID=G9HQ37_9ZZZZ|nr:MMGP4 [uncultured organism]